MILLINHPTGEGLFDQLGERLLWPFWFRESILISCIIDFVPIDAFLFPTGCLDPLGFCLFTTKQVVGVPGIVFVSRRYLTEEEDIVWLGCEGQAEAQD